MKKLVSIALIVAASLPLAGCVTNATGQKNGSIVKFAKSGLFCPTWEAELIRGGFGGAGGGAGVQGGSFDFTVEDPALVTKIKDAFDKQQEVRISYHHENFTFCRSDSDGNFLDAVEVVSTDEGGTARGGPSPMKPASFPDGSHPSYDQIATLLQQNARALDQNERLLTVIEKQVGINN